MPFKFLITLALLFLTSLNIFSLNDTSFANGWYWGKDDVRLLEKNKPNKKATHKIIKADKTKKQQLEELSKEIDEAKAEAVLEPTDVNIVKFIKLQQKAVSLSSNFSAAWSKVLISNPDLNDHSSSSDNMLAQQIIRDEKRKLLDKTINKFSKNNGLIFFFDSDNQLSNLQSKIVKSFSERYNVALIPVSKNGIGNEYFPNPQKDNNRSSKLGINNFPAIIAINTKANKYTPIAFGVISESDLQKRIYDILNDFKDIRS